MLGWIVSWLMVLGMLFSGGTPGPTPPPSPEPPPPGVEVGEVVGTWYDLHGLSLPVGGQLIHDEEEWSEFLDDTFGDGTHPPLEEGPGPDFTNAIAVVANSTICTGSFTLRHLGDGVLQFNLYGERDDVVCDLRESHSVWQVDLDELGVDREDVTLR